MSNVRTLFTEALDPLNRIVSDLARRINYIETTAIIDSKSFDEVKKLLMDTCAFRSTAFNELDEQMQEVVARRLYVRVYRAAWGTPKHLRQTEEESVETQGDLETKIYNFLKSKGGLIFPLQTTAKELADEIKKK